MISDTLHQAIEDIERYQRDMPDSYDSIRADIDAVKEQMASLRRKLDNPVGFYDIQTSSVIEELITQDGVKIEDHGDSLVFNTGQGVLWKIRKTVLRQMEEEFESLQLQGKGGKQTGNTVGITIRVDEETRHHWNVQARIERTTITDAIVEALTKRFGAPKRNERSQL
jgi:hypothetical protein